MVPVCCHPQLEMLHRESDLRGKQQSLLLLLCSSSCCSKDSQECVLHSIPHQKPTPKLAPHHPRKLISLPILLKYRQGNEIAPLYVIGCFPLPVYFSVTRKGKQGTGQLYFPPCSTWQRIHRFIFPTCGFICQSKYIKSNIGFGLDGS